MISRNKQINILSDLELEIHMLGSSYSGESILVLIKDTTKDCVLFSFLFDSFSGIYSYLKLMQKENGLEELSCICWSHPHDDHTNDLYSILQDKDFVMLNKIKPNQYNDVTRIIFPGHFKDTNSKYRFYYPTEDAQRIIDCGGSIGIKVGEYRNRAKHTWFITIKDSNIKIPIQIEFITPKEKIESIDKKLTNYISGEDFNCFSLSCIFSIGNLYSFFLGGDCNDDDFIEAIECRKDKDRIKNLLQKCKIIKIPHHGSFCAIKMSEYFNNDLDYALVSSDCRTLLPSSEVIMEYEKKVENKNQILQTKTVINGDDTIGEIIVGVKFDKSNNSVTSSHINSLNLQEIKTKA